MGNALVGAGFDVVEVVNSVIHRKTHKADAMYPRYCLASISNPANAPSSLQPTPYSPLLTLNPIGIPAKPAIFYLFHTALCLVPVLCINYYRAGDYEAAISSSV